MDIQVTRDVVGTAAAKEKSGKMVAKLGKKMFIDLFLICLDKF